MVIKNISLDHKGGYYFYRLHSLKLDKLVNFNSLKGYLCNMFKDCPHDYFNCGPRSSSLKFKIDVDLKSIAGHEICGLTRYGLMENNNRYFNNHSKVQVFMLENDDKTVAVEVPVWMTNEECKYYKRFFKTDKPLTGHIDILRIEDNKIWVWDYKPNANNEEYAVTQVYFYALMLSKRTDISLESFRCGYFDSNYAYIFKPEKCLIKSNSFISQFC